MKDGITIRRSRRGRRTTIRILVKGKAAEEFIQELIKANQPKGPEAPSIPGGAN